MRYKLARPWVRSVVGMGTWAANTSQVTQVRSVFLDPGKASMPPYPETI